MFTIFDEEIVATGKPSSEHRSRRQGKKRAVKSTASKAADHKEANEQSTNVKKRCIKAKEPNADNEREAYEQRMRVLQAAMDFAIKDLQMNGWGKLTNDLSQLWPQFIGGVRIQGHQCEMVWCNVCHSWASDGWSAWGSRSVPVSRSNPANPDQSLSMPFSPGPPVNPRCCQVC